MDSICTEVWATLLENNNSFDPYMASKRSHVDSRCSLDISAMFSAPGKPEKFRKTWVMGVRGGKARELGVCCGLRKLKQRGTGGTVETAPKIFKKIIRVLG